MKFALLVCLFLFPLNALALPIACSCVQTAKATSTAPVPLVDAIWFRDFPTTIPVIDSIVVLRYPKEWHVAVVKQITADGFWVHEGNYRPCQITHRFIRWDDQHIVKFVLA